MVCSLNFTGKKKLCEVVRFSQLYNIWFTVIATMGLTSILLICKKLYCGCIFYCIVVLLLRIHMDDR